MPSQTDRRTNIMAIARRFVLTNASRTKMAEFRRQSFHSLNSDGVDESCGGSVGTAIVCCYSAGLQFITRSVSRIRRATVCLVTTDERTTQLSNVFSLVWKLPALPRLSVTFMCDIKALGGRRLTRGRLAHGP